MPALTSYSPYETLVFVQNVIQYGTDAPAFQEISTQLTQNQLIRENVDSDTSKFSPDALQHLYEKVIGVQREEKSNLVNGDAETQNTNPRKRKLSPNPQSKQNQDTELLLQELVNTLYAKFRDETINELRKQEQEYERLQADINKFEEGVKAERTSAVPTEPVVKDRLENVNTSSSTKTEPKTDPVSAQLQANLEAVNHDIKPTPLPLARPQSHPQPNVPSHHDRARQSPAPNPGASIPRSASGTPHARPAQPPQPLVPAAHSSPSAFNRNLVPPSQPPGGHGAFPPPPHLFPYPPQGVGKPPVLSPIYGMQNIPPHEGFPQHQNLQNQGRISPMPQQLQQPYQVFSQYQQPSPNGWQSPVPQQYQQPQYSGPQQPYHPQAHGRYPQVQTPNQAIYQPHPHTAPIPYPVQQQWRGPPPHHYQPYSASANSTPVSRSSSRTPIVRSSSSTPWKNRSNHGLIRPRTPSRLQREVSPLSEPGSPPPPSSKTPVNKSIKVARRDASATPVAGVSRSQSVISNVSEAPEPPKRRVGRPPKIKAEAPATPAQAASDSEQQRSSGRRGRGRASTVMKKPESIPITAKRKRSQSPVSAILSPTHRPHVLQHVDSGLVMVSKTFGRTSQMLLSEITSHKLAGIFAKPLSERDAPGYKSLVYRPQDLKSIKAAISKGSRAAIAAIEEIEAKISSEDIISDAEQKESTPTPGPKNNNSSTTSIPTEGPFGNGFYLVRTSEDLIPPKGIVNSSQLEMELVRMFANAVMFNPLPASERGFGPSLHLRKRGGEPRAAHALHIAMTGLIGVDDNEAGDEDDKIRHGRTLQRKDNRDASEPATTTSESDVSGSSADEGGIIADSREMFEDVERQVAKWKEVEGDRLGSGNSHGYQHSGHGGVGGSFSTPITAQGQNDRHASLGASSATAEHDDDKTAINDRAGTPAGGAGMRKRRRIGDH